MNLMRQKLIGIIRDVRKPMIMNDTQIGEYRTPHWMAELIADALIENDVEIPTFKTGDIVWVKDWMWGIIPCVVDKPGHCKAGSEGGCTFEMAFTNDDIGLYVFATREEAESCEKEKEV